LSAIPIIILAMVAVPLIFAAVVAVIIVVIAVNHHAGLKRQREELQLLAARSGFTFAAEDVIGLQQRLQLFALMRKGHSKKVRHVLIGEHGGRQVILFEYVYVIGHGKHRHTHTQYCCMWQVPVQISRLVIRPEGFFDRVGDWFTGRDIDFADDPAFSDAYVISGDDESQVRALLTPAVRAFLLRSGLQCLEMVGDLALLYGRRSGLEVHRCEELLELSQRLERILTGQSL
jgi:hypothetical protein